MLTILLSPIGRWLISIFVGAAVFLGAWLFVKTHYYNQGWAAAIAAIAAQDQKAVGEASEVKKNIDLCFDSGKAWNVENGTCENL